MLKKLSAILILIAMTAALAGCGNDKDSSSKNESSATTEAITEEITEEETETLTEVPAESEPPAAESENSGSADTANTEESILGKWKSEYVLDSQGNAATVAQYSEQLGQEADALDMEIEFKDDKTVLVNSTSDGEETGTYTVDGAVISMTDDSDGSVMTLIYDTESKMILIDFTGTGSIFIGFTMQ